MPRLLRRLLFVVLALAVVGGATVQLARSAANPVMTAMPCGMAMPSNGTGHGEPTVPCKGMTPDCVKQMGCVADVAVPAPLVGLVPAGRSTAVGYWSAWHAPSSFVSAPEPLPPRTI